MNRPLAFVSAVAFVAAQTSVTLAAHPESFAAARLPAPAPRAAARIGPANQTGLKLPFVLDVRPKPLPESWYLPAQPFPALFETACSASNSFWNAPSEQQPPNFTIGSLVDGKTNMLSPQSFNGGFAANDLGATSASPLKLQVGFSSSGCGPSSFTSF